MRYGEDERAVHPPRIANEDRADLSKDFAELL
jgi:hypothetical protein